MGLASMDKNDLIYVAGHNGLAGSAIVRKLLISGYERLLLASRSEVDLTCGSEVKALFSQHRPDYVFMAAGRVGGIQANMSYPAEFLRDNILMQTNVIHSAYRAGCKRLLLLGSSCMYPKDCPQPMKEEYILTGPLEPTNEAYAIAKIAGLKLCQAYRNQYGSNFFSLIPPNLYGPGDRFDDTQSHVLGALIHRFHKAKVDGSPSVTVWGSGNARREFLFADDLADACLYLMMSKLSVDVINVGSGKDVSIRDLACLVKEIVGFSGEVVFDHSKPEGMAQKLCDVSRIHDLGWTAHTSLGEGIVSTYKWFLEMR